MKVLVTGGCGFLGSHVCEYYRVKGDEVVSFDNLTKGELMRTGYNVEDARFHNWKILKELGVSLVKGDIRNKQELLGETKDCDYIVHTAAQPAMTIAIENPELDLGSNVVGTFHVLEAARKYDIPVVVCSSIHVYGNGINETIREGKTRFIREPPSIDESYPILEGKITPLHSSKRATEIYTQAYIDTYGLNAAIYRLTGMYGPRQFGGEDHGWVANFLIRTVLGMPIRIFGTGKQVRDILYVSDAVDAIVAFNKTRASGLYNIGGGLENIISLGECLQLIRKIAGFKQKIIHEPKRLGDLWYFVCDIAKARENLGWEPKVSNKAGLEKLNNWVKANVELFGGQL